MADSLFITGATGYVGSHLLAALDLAAFEKVRLLVRRPGGLVLPAALRDAPNLEIVEGELAAPEAWSKLLDADTIVVHAAAVTGSALPEEYRAANVDGVAALLAACADRGAHRLLHLSSVAALYPDLDDYPYGRSKLESEALVRASGLDFTIARATVIVSNDSPAFGNLRLLAMAPVLVLPGSGAARLRPIDLDDLVGALVRIIETSRFRGESLDLGGPESLSCEELLRRIRRHLSGREGPVLRLPMGLLLPVLRLVERLWPGAPPVSPGQFAVFRFDGVGNADESLFTGPEALLPGALDVDAMFERSLAPVLPAAAESSSLEAMPVEPAAVDARARRECEVFSRYLTGQPPHDFVQAKYVEASRSNELAVDPGDFERLMLDVAARHPWLTRAVDVYARHFRPRSRVRKKLILLLAIAETWMPSYDELDRADAGNLPVFALRAALNGLVSVALLLGAILFFEPARLWLGRSRAPRVRS